jgi:hypothetical protein
MRAILSLLLPTQNLANREETIYVLSVAKRIGREVMRFVLLSTSYGRGFRTRGSSFLVTDVAHSDGSAHLFQ